MTYFFLLYKLVHYNARWFSWNKYYPRVTFGLRKVIVIIVMSIFFWIWLVVIATCIYKMRIPYYVRRIYLAEMLPGPIALPIIGNAYIFFNKPLTGKQ